MTTQDRKPTTTTTAFAPHRRGAGQRKRFRCSLAMALLAAMVTVSCLGTSQDARFYKLTPLSKAGATLTNTGPSLEIELVGYPGALDRPHFVTRVEQHERRFADFERWAVPLHQSLPTVLAANLRVLLGTQRIVASGDGLDLTPDVTLLLRVDRFDVTPAATAHLEARWRWLDASGNELGLHHGTFGAIAAETSTAAYVAALNDVLIQLSRRLAGEADGLGL